MMDIKGLFDIDIRILLLFVFLASAAVFSLDVSYRPNQTFAFKQGALTLATGTLLTPIQNDEFLTCGQFECSIDFDIVPAVSFSGNASMAFNGKYSNSRYGTISFIGTKLWGNRTTLIQTPTYIDILHSVKNNNTWNFWNESEQTGIAFTYSNVSDWIDFNPSSISFTAGQHYRIRQTYRRAQYDDSVDLIPELFGVQLTQFAWWNSSWTYVQQVCFTSGASSTLINFPARAEVNTSNATLFAAGNCSNVRFISTDNTSTLKYDIDDVGFCNSSVYNMTYYVEIPSFTSSAYCANLYMGNLGASSGRDSSMWLDAGYSRVMHFAAGTGCGNDSVYGTNYANFTCGLQQPMAGWTKSYVQITSGAYNSHFISPPTAASGTFGESALVITNTTSYMTIAGSYTSDYKGGGGITAQWDCSANKFGWSWSGGVNVPICDSLSFSTNTWYYLGGQRNSATNASFYRAGAYITGSASNTGSTAPTPDVALGDTNPSQYGWAGYFDEVRIHNTSRTDDWYKTEYGQTWVVSSITAFIPEPDGMLDCILPFFIPSGYSNSILVSCQKINSSHMPQTAAVINCSALSSALVSRQSVSSMTEQAGRIYTWSLSLANLPEGDCDFINCTSTSNGSIIGWGGQMCRERDIVYQVWQSANKTAAAPTAADNAYAVWQNANRTYNLSGTESAYYVWQSVNRTSNQSSADIAYYVWTNANRSSNSSNMLSASDVWSATSRRLTDYNESYIAYLVWQDANASLNLTADDVAYSVWQNINRTNNMSANDVAYAVWVNSNKTNESYMAYLVWESVNRSTSNLTAAQAAYETWQNLNKTYNLSGQEAAYYVWQNANKTSLPADYLSALEQAQLLNASIAGNLTASDIWNYLNRTLNGSVSNLTAQEVWDYVNRTLNTTQFLNATQQELLYNTSLLNVSPTIVVNASFNISFNNTYNQTSLMQEINASILDTYNQASVQATNVSTDLIFQLAFAIIAIAVAFIALMYNRTMLWIISGMIWVGLGILLYPLSLIVMICCLGIGFYLWARIFVS